MTPILVNLAKWCLKTVLFTVVNLNLKSGSNKMPENGEREGGGSGRYSWDLHNAASDNRRLDVIIIIIMSHSKIK